MRSIHDAPRGDLLYDIEPPGENCVKRKCPEIVMEIEGIDISTLVDSGSEVTCISEDFYLQHQDVFKICPTLAISGKIIRGATGQKSTHEIPMPDDYSDWISGFLSDIYCGSKTNEGLHIGI
ncbi:hypothetical protein QAD02_008166 [Eretmocerus hayati]|uniref:Uncharacterized protein n=1 Tax=Eretmocerus hayati TaxID=131215 RepID=A0ACC2N5P9_9HYME|nr:hypothetical protein QAD02_008166 [Eretmocerus hayati]